MVIQYFYTLKNDHHDKSYYHLSPHSYYSIIDSIPYAVNYIQDLFIL